MRRRSVFAIVSLASALTLACTTGEPAATDPIPETTAKPEPPPIESEPNPVTSTDGPQYFFAVAGQSGIEHCPEGASNWQWLGVRSMLGWTSTSGVPDADLDPLMDQPVLARGSAGPEPTWPPLAEEPKPCPLMQMRSDYVNTPRGMRVKRTSPTSAGHFHTTSVRRLDELKVTRVDETVIASFENPLPFTLTGVRLRMHYEGCYGKPGSTVRESDLVTLAPGESVTYEFPRIDVVQQPGPRKGGDPAREHLAAALVLEIGGTDGAPADATIWADVDVSLAKLGIAWKCD